MGKIRWMPVAICVGLAIFVACSVSAEIFVYKDKTGVLHFTNTPTSLKYVSYMSETAGLHGGTYEAEYDDLIAEAAQKKGVSFYLLKAMIHVESYFNPYAVSKKGALGLMQIMPENLDLLNVDNPFDPRDNVMGGAEYLKTLLDRFNGDLDLALAAYNAGPSVVEQYNKIPPFRETQDYVQNVRRYMQFYKKT